MVIVRKRNIAALLMVVAFTAGIGVGALGSDVLGWRARVYAKKMLGTLPELRWAEVFRMTIPPDRYQLSEHMRGGKSLDAVIVNPYNSDTDVREGGHLFAANCAMCHGADAGGGAGPSLRRPSYTHGDSVFAIYRVLRDGVPYTAMKAPRLSGVQRWQLVAYLRSVQQGRAAAFESKALEPVEVSRDRLATAGQRPEEWLTYSGNLRGWRFSRMAELTPENVGELRPAWKLQLQSKIPAQTSTPVAIDGRLFVTESPSNVMAVNARTGEVIWRYEHPLPSTLSACTQTINRGVAAAGNLLFVATFDAQLLALDANTGAVRWRTRVANSAEGYTLTLAPLVFGNTVVVGSTGGECGLRGFIAAYDTVTGKERWRFHTIPEPGEAGHESWGKGNAWESGGGPAWITGSYDADLDLIYWGIGNPSPEFQGAVRLGDNLYSDSVVALRGSTGELVWHFQFTPHDEHDWDSAQTPILTELKIDGRMRRVICWANRNGFYYVLDRENGKFLVGTPFVRQNWNQGLDATGRPILSSSGDLSQSGRRTFPGVGGGTNWYPPAYDPVRQMVFVHANDQSTVFTQTPPNKLERKPGEFYLGSGGGATDDPNFSVRALDAATGKNVWIYNEGSPKQANGISGLLATAGGLVFGTTGGRLFALESTTGRELWTQFLGGNTQAPPITFSLDGRQVVAVVSGSALTLFSR